MSFLDRHFVPVWISIIMAITAALVLWFLRVEAHMSGVESGDSWVTILCYGVIAISLLLPPALFIHHRIALRRSRFSDSVIRTFE